MKNILYIWDADYPWDIRVDKICTSLKDAGHNVHIASRNLKKQPEIEFLNDITIHRTKKWENKSLNYIFSFPLFFSPVWAKFLNKIIKRNKIDLIIVRDLPLAIAGIWAGKRFDIPVIFDMAEDYVAMIHDIWKLRKFQGLNLIVRNPYLAKLVERYTFKHIDHTWVVIDEAIDVVENGGGNKNNISIVSNTPELASFDSPVSSTNEGVLKEIKDNFSMIYTGGIQMGRGLQTVIDAIPKITAVIKNFKFVVVGDGYAASRIKSLIEEKGVGQYIIWVGWVSHESLGEFLKSSAVGIIPHLTSKHVNTTIPNKIFDYMGYGLPVIASDAPPMVRILNETECGLTFHSRDADDLAAVVIKLYREENSYSINGKMAVREHYNWDDDKTRLLETVDKLG